MFVSVLERQRAILETGIITQLSGKGTVESLLSGLWAPPDFMLAGMCVTWLHSRGNDRE